jgi:lipopolysaccharide transport system ATP-binding protein
MDGNEAIVVDKLGKKFFLGVRHRPDSLRRYLAGFWEKRPAPEKEFWALKDVSFTVKCGEMVGIIGPNGSGKSTLLKILAGIILPTTGRAVISGKVAGLLEIGSGFHPDLTGRENIDLSGAVLGMSKKDVRRKFDEIVAFSGLKKFLDTPVKHYSSGMNARLAFSVSAHLDADVVLVDEILAVGDQAFQRKSMRKMVEITKDGNRTILFVSHSLQAIQNLCHRCLLLENGRVKEIGDAFKITGQYAYEVANLEKKGTVREKKREGSGEVVVTKARAKNAVCGRDMILEVVCTNRTRKEKSIDFVFGVNDATTLSRVIYLSNRLIGKAFLAKPGENPITLKINRLPLPPGLYTVNTWIESEGILTDWLIDATVFQVQPGDFYQSGMLPTEGQSLVLANYSLV